MKLPFGTRLFFLLAGICYLLSLQPVTAGISDSRELSHEESQLVLKAEEIERSSMPDDEKIERLQEIEARVRTLRSIHIEKRSLPAIVPMSPTLEQAFKNAEAKNSGGNTAPATISQTPDKKPPLLHRIGFFLVRTAGYAILLGILAAAVFGFFGWIDRARESVRRTPENMPPQEQPRTRPATQNRVVPNPLPTVVVPRNRNVPRDGTVPARLR